MKRNFRIVTITLTVVIASVVMLHNPAFAFVATEDIYIDRGVVDYVSLIDRSIQMGEREYFFPKKGNSQLAEHNISQSDLVEIYYKRVDDKNMITRINLIQKESSATPTKKKK